MSRTRKDEAPILLDEPGFKGGYGELGDHTVSSRCQSPIRRRCSSVVSAG
jgi:hypothetical protein